MISGYRKCIHTINRFIILATLVCVLFATASCGMSTLQTPVTTPKGHLAFNTGAVFTGEQFDPSKDVPLMLSAGYRYGITDLFDCGITYLGDAAIADLKYQIVKNRSDGPCISARVAGGYGIYSHSYSAIEPLGGWNYRNIVMPYLSLRTSSYWEHEIYTFSPALGVMLFPDNNVSLLMEGRYYAKLPGSASISDISFPEEVPLPGDNSIDLPSNLALRDNKFSFNVGITIHFDPYYFY